MMEKRTASHFPARDHDHDACLQGALARAKASCLRLGVTWTALRETVFREIATSHRPIGAYDLIARLGERGTKLAPVSIYRILDVLQEANLVHRLESRNAFFACMTEHEGAAPAVVFLCEGCHRVAEADAPEAISAISKSIQGSRFVIRRTMLEVSGVCGDCHSAEKSASPC